MRQQNLWDFALALYDAEGVAEACLALQDTSRVDVPAILFGAWMGQRGVVLTAEAVVRIDERVQAWRQEVIHPLRKIRRRLKDGPAPAPSAETDALRERVKVAEIGAERIELAVLEALAGDLASGETAVPAEASARNLETLTRHFRGGTTDDATNALFDIILRALPSDGTAR